MLSKRNNITTILRNYTKSTEFVSGANREISIKKKLKLKKKNKLTKTLQTQKASINSQEARCCFQKLQATHLSATCQVHTHGYRQSKGRYKWAHKKENNGEKNS